METIPSVLDYRESNKEHPVQCTGDKTYFMAQFDILSFEILGGEPWTTVAAAMLNQRLTIPGGGLTLDR